MAAAATPEAIAVATRFSARLAGGRSEAEVIGLAARIAGIDPETLERRLDAYPAGRELFMQVMASARETELVGKLVLLAQGLAAGATGSESIAESEATFTDAVRALRAAHLSALVSLADNEWVLEGHLVQRMPELGDVVPAIIATLVRHGLVKEIARGSDSPSTSGPQIRVHYALSSTGERVVERLKLAADLLRSDTRTD